MLMKKPSIDSGILDFSKKFCDTVRDPAECNLNEVSRQLKVSIARFACFRPSLTLRKKSTYLELFWSAFFSDFPTFGLNMGRYGISLHIQSECRKMREKWEPD